MFDWAQTPFSPFYAKRIITLAQFVQIVCYITAGYQKKRFSVVFSSFIFCYFGAKFNNYCSNSLCHNLMNSYFYYAGCSRTHWAQRRTRRKWPSCKTRHQFQLITSLRSSGILFFGHSFYIFFHLS